MAFDSWKTNVLAACLGFIVVFLLSIKVNLLETSLTRGVFAAIVLLILMFVLRFMYRKIQKVPKQNVENQTTDDAAVESTEEDQLNTSDKEEQSEQQFSEEQIKAASDAIKDKLNE
ncbi:amino acid permease [Salibacterium salarium]|uniref:hypothetical protein n=1 Tax=Salibacterium salarium TaxID=284579 RepID=UPI0027833E47|nr:hypothetical protein [Salibacterium salarium]MDQ0299155.1 amino acid permease [Salibacterium salarium]